MVDGRHDNDFLNNFDFNNETVISLVLAINLLSLLGRGVVLFFNYKVAFSIESNLATRVLSAHINRGFKNLIDNSSTIKTHVLSSVTQIVHNGLLPILVLVGALINSIAYNFLFVS